MKMRHSLGGYLLLVFLLPCGKQLAVHPGAGILPHLFYPFAHASWLHFLLNGLAWAFLWKIVTPARMLAAWSLSVLVGYLLPASLPVLGWSVIIYYYWGICLTSMKNGVRLRLLLLVIVGFFIPGMAALHHAAMLSLGFIIRKVEILWQKTDR